MMSETVMKPKILQIPKDMPFLWLVRHNKSLCGLGRLHSSTVRSLFCRHCDFQGRRSTGTGTSACSRSTARTRCVAGGGGVERHQGFGA